MRANHLELVKKEVKLRNSSLLECSQGSLNATRLPFRKHTWRKHSKRQNYFQPSEFGKKSDIINIPSYMGIVAAKSKLRRLKEFCRV